MDSMHPELRSASGLNNWEKRWHPLRQEWVIVSANTGARPWSGAVVSGALTDIPRHDPNCYLCPRNSRAAGGTNPDYEGTWAFDNDFPSLALDAPGDSPATGLCRVLVWHPDHSKTLASLNNNQAESAVRLMRDEHVRAYAMESIQQVLVFENRGGEVGVSNPHPHGQLYATGHVTALARRVAQADPAAVNQMLEQGSVLGQMGGWRAGVPYCARLPYEIWLAPQRSMASLNELTEQDVADVAALLTSSYRALDGFFGRLTPLNLLWFSAPKGVDGWQLHAVIQPALRAPDKLKYFGGFEQLSGEVVNPVESGQAGQALKPFFKSS